MWNLFLTVAILLFIAPAQAVLLTVDIRGDNVRWNQSESVTNGFVPSNWFLSYGLPSAKAFTQARISANQSITLRGGGQTVSIPLEIIGFEYMSPKVDNLRSYKGSGSTQLTLDGVLIIANGVGQGEKLINLTTEATPFTHFRPIFKAVDRSTLLKSFTDVKAIRGIYTGQSTITVEYDYVVPMSGVRARHTLSVPLTISVNYEPAVLNTVRSPCLQSNQSMTTRYDRRDNVSGNILCTFTAEGVFPLGLKLSLYSEDAGNYHLIGPENKTIPFSVECSRCEDKILLRDNNVRVQSTYIDNAGNLNVLPFNLRIFFDNKKLNELKTGKYRGIFRFLIEPRI
ncbi:hypothetical protein BTO10_05265 [Vibrio chagasii]|uniref:Fimbrial protein n=1 Tax=Vibrio chagasii TaxID=170679 RepID=A0A2S7VRC6_9VIBR|nr:hypothetical protein [Vibrio chagasii]PQJ64200.1 hypothetical protein BTO10_05265 [Vibrio chagasii]